jgi:UDP-glucose 4-epimerase
MTALVTGAGGFIGRALCAALAARGETVRAVSRTQPSWPVPGGVDWRTLDLADAKVDWTALLEGVDTLHHLAWTTIPATAALDPGRDVAENLGGLVRLLDAARARPDLRIVFASSGGTVYGAGARLPIAEDQPTRPIGVFGMGKLAGEQYLTLFRETYGISSVALRIGNAYGAGQDPGKGLGAVAAFARGALDGRPLVVFGDGRVVRDFVHVDDVVSAFLAAGEARHVCGALNIGSGEGRSLLDVVATLRGLLARPIEVEHRAPRPFDVPACVLDASRAREAIGWVPRVSFETGVRRLVDGLAGT